MAPVTERRPVAPALSYEQRRAAWDRSLELRRERAHLKAFLSGAKPGVLGLFMTHAWRDPAALGMKVYSLLCALPGVGPKTARRLMQEAGIPEKNTVRACGPRQTEKLFLALG